MELCIDCGKELSKWAKYDKTQRCHSCEAKRRHKLGILNNKGINNNTYKDGRYLKKHYCIDCNKELNKFNPFSIRCRSCATKYQMKDPLLHPSYIDGRSFKPYPTSFTEALKRVIRTRDDTRCQKCGITGEEHLIQYNELLHVHHIDYNKENCAESNLITLCIKCNSQVNKNRSYWQQYFKNKIKEMVLC